MKIRITLLIATLLLLALPAKAQLDKATFNDLKTLFSAINANLPLQMGPSGEFYACDIDEEKITYYVHTQIVGAAMKLPDKEKRLQTVAMLSSMKENKNVRAFYEIIAETGMSLRIVVSDKTSGAKYEVVLSPDDIRQVLNNEFSPEEQLDIMLAQQKATVPIRVAEGLTINRIYKENGLVVMGCEVDEMLVDLDELIAQKANAREKIRRSFSADITTTQFLYIVRNAGYGLQYLYKGNHTGQELPITFTLEDLRSMLGDGEILDEAFEWDEEEVDSAVADSVAYVDEDSTWNLPVADTACGDSIAYGDYGGHTWDAEEADTAAVVEDLPLVLFEKVGFATIAYPSDSQYDAEGSEQTGFTCRISESYKLVTMHRTFSTESDFNPETAILEELVGMEIDPSTTQLQYIEQAEGHKPIPYVVATDSEGSTFCLCICHNPDTREALVVITMEPQDTEGPFGPAFIQHTRFN